MAIDELFFLENAFENGLAWRKQPFGPSPRELYINIICTHASIIINAS